jgi:hypothetical protein
MGLNYLFIHQSMPSQFAYLAAALAAGTGNSVVFLTQRAEKALPGVRTATYRPARLARAEAHRYVRVF